MVNKLGEVRLDLVIFKVIPCLLYFAVSIFGKNDPLDCDKSREFLPKMAQNNADEGR